MPPTPPPPTTSKPPMTPELQRRIETNRLRAKAIREARERAAPTSTAPPPTSRKGGSPAPNIRPARRFARYVDYDLSQITDTKGGFLSGPSSHPPAAAAASRIEANGPGLSVLQDTPGCRECGGLEIDYRWREVLNCCVCERCKKMYPERYSLLTKTEAREDYLLTEPELKDAELLPHLELANPHKATWSNMMLYVRYQVEEVAVRKWGSFEKLDEEFAKRVVEKKRRNEKKFSTKLGELKKRTRVDAWKRERAKGATGAGRHEHVWGTAITRGDTGETVRTCQECGFEIEELVF